MLNKSCLDCTQSCSIGCASYQYSTSQLLFTRFRTACSKFYLLQASNLPQTRTCLFERPERLYCSTIPSFVRYDDRNSTLKNSTLFPRLSACLVRSSTSLVPVTGTTMYFLLLLVSRLVVVPRRSNKPVAYFRLVPSFELGYFRLVPSFE